MKKLLLLFALFLFITETQAQDDSVAVESFPELIKLSLDTVSQEVSTTAISDTDTVGKEKKVKLHSPKTAAWLSTAVPSLGQIYNRKYWKAPIVYAGLGVSAFLIYYYHKEYVYYRTEYRLRLNSSIDIVNSNVVSQQNPELADLNTENIYSYENVNRRNMELSIIALSVFYILNIVDAAVDAHLMSFDISEDLSMQFIPYSNNNHFYTFLHTTPNIGFTLQLDF